MNLQPRFSSFLRRTAWPVALLLLGACGDKADGGKPGWALEKTGDATAQLVQRTPDGKRHLWPGKFTDDSPRGSVLNPLPAGQDNGLFRWSRQGCAELSFVLTREGLKCTTCMQPGNFVPFGATCPIDQQRLPIQGWVAVGLERPR